MSSIELGSFSGRGF
ncbi:hypothetical protein LINPERPRIM_LOCUS22547 [Linum perenne]